MSKVLIESPSCQFYLKSVFEFLHLLDLLRGIPFVCRQFYHAYQSHRNTLQLSSDRSLFLFLNHPEMTERIIHHLFETSSLLPTWLNQTLFEESCARDFLSIVRLLTNAVYRPTVLPSGNQNRSLHLSVLKGHGRIVEYLLKFVNPNVAFFGNYPIVTACSKSGSEYDRIVDLLLENKADPGVKNNLALRLVCKYNCRVQTVRKLLVHKRVDPNIWHEMALRISIRWRSKEIVREFLQNERCHIGKDYLAVVKINKSTHSTLGNYLRDLDSIRRKFLYRNVHEKKLKAVEESGKERERDIAKLVFPGVIGKKGFQKVTEFQNGSFVRLSKFAPGIDPQEIFNLLFRLEHPDIVRCVGMMSNPHSPGEFFLMTECYNEECSLANFLSTTSHDAIETISVDSIERDKMILDDLTLCRRICEAVKYLNSEGVFFLGYLNVNNISVFGDSVKLDYYFGSYCEWIPSDVSLLENVSEPYRIVRGYRFVEPSDRPIDFKAAVGDDDDDKPCDELIIPECNIMSSAPEQVLGFGGKEPPRGWEDRIDVYSFSILINQIIFKNPVLYEEKRIYFQNKHLDRLELYPFMMVQDIQKKCKRPQMQQFPVELKQILKEKWDEKVEEFFKEIVDEIIPVNVYRSKTFAMRGKVIDVEGRKEELEVFLKKILVSNRNEFGSKNVLKTFSTDVLDKFDWKKVRKRMASEEKEAKKLKSKKSKQRKTLGGKKFSQILEKRKERFTNTYVNVKKATDLFKQTCWEENFRKYYELCLLPRLAYEWECRSCNLLKIQESDFKSIHKAFVEFFLTPLEQKLKGGSQNKVASETSSRGEASSTLASVKKVIVENWTQLSDIKLFLLHYPYQIFDIMRSSWEKSPQKRPFSMKAVLRRINKVFYLENNRTNSYQKRIQNIQIQREDMKQMILDISKEERRLHSLMEAKQKEIVKSEEEAKANKNIFLNTISLLRTARQDVRRYEASIEKQKKKCSDLGNKILNIDTKRTTHLQHIDRLKEEEEVLNADVQKFDGILSI